MITYEINAAPTKQELTELYDSVGWSIYTKDPIKLTDAVSASLYVVTAQLSFYKSMGFRQTGELDFPLNTFVKFD